MLGVSHTLSKRSTTKLYPQISDFFGLYICKKTERAANLCSQRF